MNIAEYHLRYREIRNLSITRNQVAILCNELQDASYGFSGRYSTVSDEEYELMAKNVEENADEVENCEKGEHPKMLTFYEESTSFSNEPPNIHLNIS